MTQLNAKAMNILCCALDANKFNKISTCIFIKDIWNKLEVTYEDSNEVKKSKINVLVHKYKLFKMEPHEIVIEMISKSIDIINSLKSPDKSYINTKLA